MSKGRQWLAYDAWRSSSSRQVCGHIVRVSYASLIAASQLVDGEYDEVEEELKELDESHDGEAEPQTEHAAWVWDELQQLTTQSHSA